MDRQQIGESEGDQIMNRTIRSVILLFLAQIILLIWSSGVIFYKEANPFACLAISLILLVYCFKVFLRTGRDEHRSPAPTAQRWAHAGVASLGLLLAYEELRKIWVKYPDPVMISDVLPQLEWQCNLFFSGQFPYQTLVLPTHQPFPVYMPLHWGPIQIANLMQIDTRWSGALMLLVALGIAGYWLRKTHPTSPWLVSLPALLLLVLPLWAFIWLADVQIAVSLETVVAAWYLLLAAGLATRNHWLIGIGICGAMLSRYSLICWIPLFAYLLWRYEPKKYSYYLWGTAFAAGMLLFVLPFWLKDPGIVSKITGYYDHCSVLAWIKPDQYTYLDGLSFNIHLREWLPGSPEQNWPFARAIQFGLQLVVAALGAYFYHKKWRERMDTYTFSLFALTVMLLLFYQFSPMIFKYYMLTPLTVVAVLCWKTIVRGGG